MLHATCCETNELYEALVEHGGTDSTNEVN